MSHKMYNKFYIPLLLAINIMYIFQACGTDSETGIPKEDEKEKVPDESNVCVNGITYLEKDGIISAEFESVEGNIAWNRATDIAGFDGTGYLMYTKENNFKKTGEGLLTYKLTVETPGTYQFVWRSRIAQGDSNTDFNDTWLRFPDADDFYGNKDESTVFPKGLGKTPVPEGDSFDGWFKVYMNRANEWFWRSSTSDNDPHNIFVRFDTPGVYTMEISARSTFHALDRFVLFKEGITLETAQGVNRSEIVCP